MNILLEVESKFNDSIKRFDLNTIDRFKYYLKYNIETYLQLYQYFIQNNLQSIINYYQDSIAQPDRQSFDFLDKLLTEGAKISDLIKLNKNNFKRIDDWEMLDFLENINIKLITIKNTDRWTRSSKTQNSWQGNVIQTNHTMQDHETLEDVSSKVYGSTNSQNDWMRIAIENDIAERNYTVDGGALIKITKNVLSSPNYFTYSIVDNLTNEKLYGKDFTKKLKFIEDDLEVLGYKETAIQSIEICVSIKKGDVPEFKTVGVDPRILIGGTYGALKYSSIDRQLKQTFLTDDSLRGFDITRVSYEKGALMIDYTVNTLYNLTYSNTAVKI